MKITLQILLRNIFNGDWETIPNNIREELQAKNVNNNESEKNE